MTKSSPVFILILIITLGSFSKGCKKEIPQELPKITTLDVTILIEDAVPYGAAGGTIISTGGSPIKSSGVCWSTNELPTVSDFNFITGTPTPTIPNSHPVAITGTGTFSCSIFGVHRSTTYYVRAYAINDIGIAYGNQVTFTTPCVWWMDQISIDLNSPYNESVVRSINPRLEWWSFEMFESVSTSYDVYLDTIPNPTTKIATNLSADSLSLTGLNPGKTYYWKVYGWETSSPCNNNMSDIHKFTIASALKFP